MRRKVVVALVVLLVVLVGLWLYKQLKIDSCLDDGGRWNEQQSACEYQ